MPHRLRHSVDMDMNIARSLALLMVIKSPDAESKSKGELKVKLLNYSKYVYFRRSKRLCSEDRYM